MRQRSREQVIGATLAVLVTMIIGILFLVDPKVNTQPGEQIIYADSWPLTVATPRSPPTRRRTRPRCEAAKKEKQRQFQKSPSSSGLSDALPATGGSWRSALALGDDARGLSAPNPNVGCVIVSANGESLDAAQPRAAAGPTPRPSR